jgi:hypothetical protein
MRRATIASAVLLFALPLALAGRTAAPDVAPAAQIAAGVFANWGDGETWSRYLDLSDETDIGLGLHPSGKGGTMLISFSARWHSRIVSGQPQAISVQVAAPALINPNTVRLPNLVFSVDSKTDRFVVMDFSSRLAVDRPGPIAPGAEVVTSGVAKMELAELSRLGRATALTATILSVDVEFSAKQRQALKTYAQKVASQR